MPEAQKTPRVGHCEALCALLGGEAGPLPLLTGFPLFGGLFPPGDGGRKKKQEKEPGTMPPPALPLLPAVRAVSGSSDGRFFACQKEEITPFLC